MAEQRKGIARKQSQQEPSILSRVSWGRVLVYVLCFASGIAGLTYEVIWQRVLAVVLGNSAVAASAVLAAVMCGLGLGSLYAAKFADRTNALKVYGYIEVALGVAALLVPLGARFAGAVAPDFLVGHDADWVAATARFVTAAAVVLVPAVLMGATLPLLARFAELGFKGRGDGVGPSAALVYGANTAGAALGCVLTGYVLLGRIGVFWTNGAAATVDILVGGVAICLAARLKAPGLSAKPADETTPTTTSLPPRLVLALAAISGGAVLALEGLWTRFLRVVFGHDVHAFSSMLAAVLIGLAVGSWTFSMLPRRIRTARALIPGLFGLLGLGEVLTLALVGRLYLESGLDIYGVHRSLDMARSHEQGLVLQALFALTLVVGTAAASGALLPALCAAYRPDPSDQGTTGAGRRVGHVLAANTFGSIVGAILPVALLIPLLGLQRSFVAVGALAIAAAALSWAASRGLPGTIRALGAALAIIVLALSSMAIPADLPQQVLLRKIGPLHLRFELYKEGATGTVAVVANRLNDERQLFVNGVNEVTTRLVHDQSFKLLGHLGLLLHGSPEDVLVICLGAGLSAGAVTTHDVETIRIVDLEGSVVDAARLFASENNSALDDPRVTISIEDGRHHLRTTDSSYDVIIVDSTHPRAVDSWLLYTREFYSQARSRLDREGFFVQWVPLHGLSVDEFRIIVHTFLSEFPQGSMWANVGFERYGQAAYALLVGPRGRDEIDRLGIAERLAEPRVRRDLIPWGLHTVPEILECFVAGPRALRRWSGHLPVNSDDLPLTQFLTSYSRAMPMTAARLLEVREPVTSFIEPALGAEEVELAAELRRRYLAQGFLMAGRLERALEVCGPTCDKPPAFALAVEQGPPYFMELGRIYEGDPDRLLEIAAGLAGLGRDQDAEDLLQRAVEIHRTDARLWLNLGLMQASRGEYGDARSSLRASLTHNPGSVLGRLNLGLLELRARRFDEGLDELRRAVELDPSVAEAHAALGFGLFESDQQPEAEVHLLRALDLDPRNHDARITLGRLRLAQERDDEALLAFSVAHRLYPYDSDVLFNLGLAFLRTEQPREAVSILRTALRVDPHDRQAAALLEAAETTESMMP